MTSGLDVFFEEGVDHASGLAFDEAMARECGEAGSYMLRVYSYLDHCVLVGRFQRVEAEVNLSASAALGIGVNRRPTGGGAILMGKDQVGIAFAAPSEVFSSPRNGFLIFAKAVVDALSKIGVQASLRGKNDIEVAGRKIAGLGFCQSGAGLLFHASLLRDLNVELMLSLLRIPLSKLAAHGVSGVRDRITTLDEELDYCAQTAQLNNALVAAFESTFSIEASFREPSDSLTTRASLLTGNKYGSQAWLFDGGYTTSGEFLVDCRSEIGTLRLVISHQGDVIKSVVVTGDFNSISTELLSLEESLRWALIEGSHLRRRIAENAEASKIISPAELSSAICTSYALVRPIVGPRRIGSCYLPEEMIS